MKFKFRGLMAPVFTPFSNDGAQSLNLEVIPKYAKFLSSIGINAVLVNGTSGEGMSMTMEERKIMTEAWLSAAQLTKQTVMVQVGGTNYKDVLEMAIHAEKLGVGGLLCLPDLFNRPATSDDLVIYLRHVGDAAPKTPLLYYHLPAYTGVNLNMPNFLAAAAKSIPTFAGAKFTHTNLDEGAQCLSVSDDLSLFLGCDQVLAGAFVLGFDSAIATTLNMIPGPSQNILNAVKNSQTTQALQEQKKLNAAITAITCNGGWVSTMKAAMNVMTPINVGSPRPPLQPLTPHQVEQMKQDLAQSKSYP